jgi:uncharacterized protein
VTAIAPDSTAPLPYRCASRFARERFGAAVFRVVVDAGFGCPVRDGRLGRDGCVYCSIDGFRPPTSRPDLPIASQVARALTRLRARFPRAAGFLAYFQPYTNTDGPPERIEQVCAEAIRIDGCLGVVIGTRPDALPEPVLEALTRIASRTHLQIELGVQSTDDAALAAMGRGHDWACAQRAIRSLRARGIRVGAHMLLATPWESRARQIEGARRLAATGIDAVKLHHLQVVRGSRLARSRPESDWDLPGWREYASLAADFIERLDARIVIERLCASASPRLLIAPRWPVGAARVRREIIDLLGARGSRQGGRAAPGAA